MMKFEEPEDPLTDPFASIADDPLSYYNENNTSSSDAFDFEVSIPSATISSSLCNIAVQKIPVPNDSNLIKEYPKVNTKLFASLEIKPTTSKKVLKRERKQNLKVNAAQIESLKTCYIKLEDPFINKNKISILKNANLSKNQINIFKKNNTNVVPKSSGVSKLALLLKGELDKDNQKCSQDLIIKSEPVNPPILSGTQVIIEVDPAHYYPDEPYKEPKRRRKKRQDIWDNLPHKCNICNKGFKILKGLFLHKRYKHNIEDLAGCYPCECCIQVFWMKRDLLQHITEHQDEKGRLPCPEKCGVSETDVLRLARHKNIHHPYLGTLGRNWFHSWCDR